MRHAELFGTPVTGGNVSFYNENPKGAVYPTPTIGMLGVLENVDHATTAWFKNAGDIIALIGDDKEEIGGSEYLATIHGKIGGGCPALDLQQEKAVQETCLTAIKNGLILSAHDVADGGLAIALAECCILNAENPLGAKVKLPEHQRIDGALFGESQSRIVLSVASEDVEALREICKAYNVHCHILGEVSGDRLIIDSSIDVQLSELTKPFYNSIKDQMSEII